MLTQRRLAMAAQVSERTVRRIELGLVVPNMATRRTLSAALRHAMREVGALGDDEHLTVAWSQPSRLAEAA